MAAPWMIIAFRLPVVRFCRNFVQLKARRELKTLEKTSSSERCFSSETRRCWQCAKYIRAENLTCPKCGRVQKALEKANYFKVLGIGQRFDISTSELAEKFKALQGLLHPDRFAAKSEREQEYSSECSSLVNAAYKTLLRPLDRAEYLLRLAGQEKANSESGPEMDAGFLSEIMEVNEVLAETRPSDEQLRQIVEENGRQTKSALERLTEALDGRRWTEAKVLLAQLRYFDNIEKKIRDMELERQGDGPS